jgi:hypothetical protein
MRELFLCLLIAGFGLIALVTAAEPVDARICDDSARLSAQLANRLGAEKRAEGQRAPDTSLEVWVVQGSGHWTMLQRYDNGTSCIIATGEYWETLPVGEDPA